MRNEATGLRAWGGTAANTTMKPQSAQNTDYTLHCDLKHANCLLKVFCIRHLPINMVANQDIYILPH